MHDSDEVERQALGRQRATQILAPQTMENPIFFHAADVSDAGFKAAVDQMQEVSCPAANRFDDDPSLYTTPDSHVKRGYCNTDGADDISSVNRFAAEQLMWG